MSVANAPSPGGVGIARQTGLEAVNTPFAAWLDADDAWIPGRAVRLVDELNAGADIVADVIELYDGTTTNFLRRLEVPEFIAVDPHPIRLFERNYLPGDTQVGFRVETFRRAGGYDAGIIGPESFDLLLRALLSGARFTYRHEAGYRMFAYPNSVSRDIARQRMALKAVLLKHDYEIVRKRCLANGYSRRVTAWILTSMAMYRDDPTASLRFIDEASLDGCNWEAILEPKGPCPVPELWRRAFMRGTALLQLADGIEPAIEELKLAEHHFPTAEGANNLGVALRRLGHQQRAAECFRLALERFPGYRDAELNSRNPAYCMTTTHPLRRLSSRSEYTLGH